MSKMAEMAAEIEDMFYDDNLDVDQIAKRTGFPVEDVASFIDEMKEQDECDESMDGDFDSAMASAGFGTDEDYGCSAEDML